MLDKICGLLFVITGCILYTPANATVKSYTKQIDGVTFTLDKGLMKISVCRDDIIEVKYTIFKSFSGKTSLVVNNRWLPRPAFNVTESGDTITIVTKKLKVEINKLTNAIPMPRLAAR